MRTYTRKRPNHQLIENVHDLCRLCLGKADGVVPIFTEDKNNVCAVLALRIMICVGLEVKQEDCLPNVICTECLNNLNKYYAFRKKCEVSYQRLKSHVLAVKERQYKIELQKQNEIVDNKKKLNAAESEEEMKLVVSFDRNQVAQVSLLNLNSIANVNNLNNKLSGVTNLNIEDIVKLQSSQEQAQESETPEPDIGTFLTAMLLQLGILTQQDGGPVLTEQSISSLDVETGDGSQVTFELVEEEESEPVLEESIVTPVDPVEKREPSEQNDVIIKYVAADYAVPKPVEKSKKAIATENKKNGAWCDECGKQLATRSALHRHRRIHSGEKPYPCQQCGRSFGQKEVMMRHALVHEARRPHACAACPKSFTQRAALAAHERAHAPPHARALALHRCARCPKVFLYASGLSRHMLVHTGRVYVCGACERQFRDKSSLMRHFRNANHRAS